MDLQTRLLFFQPRQPLPRIVNFGEAGIGVFPKGEESFVKLDGFGCVALLFMDLAQHVEGFGVDVAKE